MNEKIIDLSKPILFTFESATVIKDFKVISDDGNVIETTLQAGDEESRNNAFYKLSTIIRSLDDSTRVQEAIANKMWFSEVGHPETKDVQRLMKIDFDNVGARIDRYWVKGDLVKGIVQWAPPKGAHFKELVLEHGSNIAFSLRAYTPNYVKRTIDGRTVVEKTYPMYPVNYDIVHTPGHYRARMVDPDTYKQATANNPTSLEDFSGREFEIENPKDQIIEMIRSEESMDILSDLYGVDMRQADIVISGESARISPKDSDYSLRVSTNTSILNSILS